VDVIPHAFRLQRRIEVQVKLVEVGSVPELRFIENGYPAALKLQHTGILKLFQNSIGVEFGKSRPIRLTIEHRTTRTSVLTLHTMDCNF
jgi:hypothetical protein